MKLKLATCALATLMPAFAQASTVDLSTWAGAEGAGSWIIASDNNSVYQTTNGSPTVFHSGVASQGLQLSGTIEVQTTSDDDYIGFVLGYNSGDLTNSNADYLLIDWKQGDQTFFGCPASAGLSVSHVSGVLGNDTGAWCHDPTKNVTELDRATNLGSTGWADNTEYTFDLVFTSSLVEVKVNGVTEISITGTFADGAFGFYNYSQSNVQYAGLTEDVAPSPVPLPASMPMLLAGVAAVGFARRRKG